MKCLTKIIALSALAFGLASCNFLDENMDTKYTADQIYGSEDALEVAVNGCYSSFFSVGFRSGSMNEYFQPASAISHWGGAASSRLTDSQKRWICCLSLTRFSKEPNNKSNFSSLYSAIYKCNKLLSELPSSPVNEAFKKQIEGEAKFIRAEAYFYLTRIWGNVPLNLEVATTVEQTNKKRSDFWVIYEQIFKDLDDAEELMRTLEEQKKMGHYSDGRACNYAPKAAKSIVYLTLGTLLKHADGDNFWVCPDQDVWDAFSAIKTRDFPDGVGEGEQISIIKALFNKSLEYAEACLPEKNAASPYKLANHYADLFKWTETEDFQLPERILVAPTTNEVGGSTLAMWLLPSYYMDTPKASNGGRYRPSRFLFQTWCGYYGGVAGTGNAENIYVKCGDKRMDAALIYNSYPGEGMATVTVYPNASWIYSSSHSTNTPFFKKYYDPGYNYTAGNADLYLIRLAEIYLVAAEAEANLAQVPGENEQLHIDNSIAYVNYVLARGRKYVDDNGLEQVSTEPADWTVSSIQQLADTDGISATDELIKKIFWERAFELCAEQHEYYDTHRMGAKWLATYVTAPHNDFLFLDEQGDYGEALESAGYRTTLYGSPGFGAECIYPEDPTLVRKGLIHSYPYDELINNSVLTMADQNPSEVFWE